ncbi:MAG: hypothetical protein H7144_04210 [Burkholderiales bacterium]|nr:hypothetical protein [Phycisphaerae bacterium]
MSDKRDEIAGALSAMSGGAEPAEPQIHFDRGHAPLPEDAPPPDAAASSSSGRSATPVRQPVSPGAPTTTATLTSDSAPKPAMQKSAIEFRRTLIPPCLVLGAMLIGLAITYWFQSPTAMLRRFSVGVPTAAAIFGALLIALGVFNMLVVKNELDARK